MKAGSCAPWNIMVIPELPYVTREFQFEQSRISFASREVEFRKLGVNGGFP